MKRLLILTDHDFIGGAEVNYRDSIESFEKQGYEINFVAPGIENIKNYFENNNHKKVKYHSLPSKYTSIRNKKGSLSLINIIRIFFALKKNSKAASKIINSIQPTAVISNAIISHVLIASINTKFLKIAHIQDIIDTKSACGIYGMLLKYVLKKVDKVITISDAVLHTFTPEFSYKYHKVYNPVLAEDIYDKETRGKDYIVGMFARYVKWKGHEELIKVVELVRDNKINNIKFVCFGNNQGQEAYFTKLKELIVEKNLQDYIKLNTFTHNVMLAMSNCDLILHMSNKPEPFGRVLIEANKLKKPLLAFNGGGVEELFKNLSLTGKLINNYDLNKFYNELILFYKKRDKHLEFPSLDELSPQSFVKNFINIICNEKDC